MKNNNKLSFKIKIVIALFILSIASLFFGLRDISFYDQYATEMVIYQLFLISVYVLIVYGLVLMRKWSLYLVIVDAVASLAKSFLIFPEFLYIINSIPAVQSGEISAGRISIIGLIPIIITIYILYAVISERKSFKD